MAVNTASRATMTAAGISFVRGFVSAEAYEDPLAGSEHGEVEYDITYDTWRRRHEDTGAPSPGRRESA